MNYVGKFVPNLSEMITPLRELLVKNVSWHWGNEPDVAIRKIKEVLVSKRCFAYYDLNKMESQLHMLQSPLHQLNQRCAIIEQEMLANVLACQRFHQYIYGKKEQIGSYHKPLESIMKKAMQNTSPRL